ncbi:hypothetical protein SGPA1_10608 [Streptomyces misionensis JCM 4497]
MLDAGYDAPRIAHLLGDLPIEILGRLRSDRVMRRPTPSLKEYALSYPQGGRPPKHGGEFVFGDPATWGTEQAVTDTDTRRYRKATAQAWDRPHPRLTRRAAWLDHDGLLPLIEGTVIRLVVEKLPSGGVRCTETVPPITRWAPSLAAQREPAAHATHDNRSTSQTGKMSDMVNAGNTSFVLPRGATGFFWPKEGPLPKTDLRAFRTALYAAARGAGGKVGEVEEQTYPRTFHTASVVGGAGESIVLCHAHHPWIAFAQTRRNWYEEEFLAPPPWGHAFTDAGFVVLSNELLATPLSDVDTSALGPGEWRELRFYSITTLGGVLFNAWD